MGYRSSAASMTSSDGKRGRMSASYSGTIVTARSIETQQRMDTEGITVKEKFAKMLAQAEKPVEAVTPIKWIGDDIPKFLDRYEDDVFYKRSAKHEPETPTTPASP